VPYKPSNLRSAYEGTNVPDDFFMPSCGIEDVDRALFNLFDKDLQFEVKVNEQTTKVPVVFAAGERFALTRRRQPIRDKNNALILPVVAIARKSLDLSPDLGGFGTPIAPRDQESYIVRKKLSPRDRDYQNLINKLMLKNQSNVATRANFGSNDIFPGNTSKPGTVASRRNKGNMSFKTSKNGYLLKPDLGDNIFEIITIPYPEFFLAEYEIIFWTQYTIHMNQLIETMMARFSFQGHQFPLSTDKGYEFVAYVIPTLTSGDNFSDYSSEERIIRYSFTIKIPGYLIAPKQPGLPSPFRKFLSAPQIEFGTKQVRADMARDIESDVGTTDINKFILSDVEILNKKGEVPLQRGEDDFKLVETIEDPFTGKTVRRRVKVLTRNQRSGETVASFRIVTDLDTITNE